MISRRSLYTIIGNAGLTVALAACQAKSPALTGPQRAANAAYVPPVVDANKKAPIVPAPPMVDILFVIDNSGSMRNHLTNLSDNIEKFVDGFAQKGKDGKASAIDFHIAYTFATDPKHYNRDVPQVCAKLSNAPGRVNWSAPGSLEPIIGLADKSRHFVTAQDDFRILLRDSLDPEKNATINKYMHTYIEPVKGDTWVCPFGPEKEDLITPLLNAVDDPTLSLANGPNQGFRRPGAFFVAIIISDTKNITGEDAKDTDAIVDGRGNKIVVEQALQRIESAVGPNKRNGKQLNFRIFSVVLKPNDPFTKTACVPDPQWTADFEKSNNIPDHALASLAFATEDGSLPKNSQVLSICDKDYGDTLAIYGAKVQEDVLSDIEFQLSSTPELTNDPKKALKVILKGRTVEGGSRELVQSEEWDFYLSTLTIKIYTKSDDHPKGVDWTKYPGASIVPSWTPVSKTGKYATPAE
jgi:hypothetical protein